MWCLWLFWELFFRCKRRRASPAARSRGNLTTLYWLYNGQQLYAETLPYVAPPTLAAADGLWPQYEGKGWPSCCTNETFNENEISSLFEDLDKYWPSYRCGLVGSCDSRKGSFWAHQYEKHGTCGTPVILQEYDYFLTTLTLFFKYNVTKALENAEIIASDIKKYPIQDVVNAVHLAFKANPKLACAKRGIIKEIYLCFDKQFKLRDCDATKSCPKAVKLPEFHDPQAFNLWRITTQRLKERSDKD
ncbi:ribonuclease 2-like isoform X3 [Benincasa hispida]|uniref:ribonuclease 2-like isoform X3 n=1 Tax=Benincasa hispida TaxID=102211 RepID=UPI0019007F86|nr:ribonuclease 2-like isoform X3 [Benincasa hispida]